MRSLCALLLVILSGTACKRGNEPSAPTTKPAEPSVLETISNLASQGEQLREVPFPIVVEGSTGKKILPADDNDPISNEIVNAITEAITTAIETLNLDDSPVRNLRRINEASRFFEDEILKRLNATEAFTCEVPSTTEGKPQRSGYPDLKIIHKSSGRVAYLDPKLFEEGGRNSTLRTFYFEPKIETNKILEDAHHFLIGIEHDGNDGAWQFSGWHLVDLSKLVVRLKPEFQASNRDIYKDEAVLKQSD